METADARYRKNKKLIGKRELTYIGLQTGCDCLVRLFLTFPCLSFDTFIVSDL
jgi:hypothetical protein